uniref:Chitin-binding type-2 domain-containing protein n=2 Tax=Lutzomyia longipalpis TaxID=7200 RepID=A0A1B0GIR3_LUTLO
MNEVYVQQHPSNCSKYILCFNGVVHIRNCAPGLEWDSSREQCNVPADAQCQPSVCPLDNDPHNLIFLYDDNQCENFAICVNGLPQWRSCIPGFHWDRVNEWCTTPQKAGCEKWEEPPIDEIECHEDSPLRNPHPTECGMYFLCVDGQSFLRHCADGLIFDYITQSCTKPMQRNGELDHVCENDDESPIREHPDTCLKFIVCDSGTAWPLPCADGHVFVRELYACVPGNVETCEPF